MSGKQGAVSPSLTITSPATTHLPGRDGRRVVHQGRDVHDLSRDATLGWDGLVVGSRGMGGWVSTSPFPPPSPSLPAAGITSITSLYDQFPAANEEGKVVSPYIE